MERKCRRCSRQFNTSKTEGRPEGSCPQCLDHGRKKARSYKTFRRKRVGSTCACCGVGTDYEYQTNMQGAGLLVSWAPVCLVCLGQWLICGYELKHDRSQSMASREGSQLASSTLPLI